MSIQEIMSMQQEAVSGLLTGSKSKATGLDFNQLIAQIITSSKKGNSEETAYRPFSGMKDLYQDSKISLESGTDVLSLISGLELSGNLNEGQNEKENASELSELQAVLSYAVQGISHSDSEVQKAFMDILNRYAREEGHGEMKDVSDNMAIQLQLKAENTTASFRGPEQHMVNLITQWMKGTEKDGLPNSMAQEGDRTENLQSLLNPGLQKRQQEQNAVEKLPDQISKMDLLKEQKTNFREILQPGEKAPEFAKSVQESGKNVEISTYTPESFSDSMIKLKELSEKFINDNAAAGNKDMGKTEDLSSKIQKNPEITGISARSVSGDDSAQLQKEDHSQGKAFHEKATDTFKNTETEEPTDHLKPSFHKSVETDSVVKETNGQEILSQSGKVKSSNSPLIRNLGDIQMEIIKKTGQMSEKEKSVLTVKLQPEELGRMKIELELKDGTVHGKIFVENESAKNALQQNIQAMRSQMKEQGISVGNLEVDIGNESFQNFEDQQETMKEANRSFWGSGKQYEAAIDDFNTDVNNNSNMVNRLNALA